MLAATARSGGVTRVQPLSKIRTSPATAIIAGAALATVALRLAYVDAPLTRDEGGDTFIAQAFGQDGPFAYGRYFVDRPPLLLAVYRVGAALDGATGVRIVGVLAALALVAMTTLLARNLGGRRAAPFAAAACAALVCSQATGVLATPSELLAAVPSCLSVLLLVASADGLTDRVWRLFGAGLAAGAALLVKQSFLDALAACAAGLAVAWAVQPKAWRTALVRAQALTAGVATAVAALVVWAVLEHRTAHEVWYAIGGFRLDAAPVLAPGQLSRLSRLGSPLLYSGLLLSLPVALVSFARMRSALAVRAALVVWLLAGIAGVVAGGSYSQAYVIELMPAAAVGFALACAARPRLGVAALAAVLTLALVPTLRGVLHDSADSYGQEARAMGSYVRARALPGQTAYVLYARANVLYYAGLPSPFPYHWALMMRAIPGTRQRLRSLLAGSARPTWIVEQDPPSAYGLDASGRTRRLLAQHYRQVAVVCATPILIARGAKAGPAPPPQTCR